MLTDETKRKKLNRLRIHILNEERSVRFIKWEIHIQGKTMFKVSVKKDDHQQKHKYIGKI